MNIFYSDLTESPFNNFLKQYGVWIAISFALIIVIVLSIFLIASLLKKKSLNKQSQINNIDNDEVLIALGGKDNIIEHFVNGSRLSLILKNYDVVNIEKLNELGFPSVIKMSNKITLVYEGDLESLAKRIFNE